ncbi:unnamed protein product [Prorocentrum cordatum]|uniref:Uncharacterized protein n=1 Tax=Prorocentrum cordatum TaxID=2364126 RepID=A0ABN9PTG9_9DINO|nr:unnamed protein product [Polarella glacialis]
MCSCGGWNWDWRTTCLGCGYAAPPWALDAAAKAKPQADKDGWVDQPRGRRAQRQARSAATSAPTSKSQTSASGASGTPSGSGATAIERLQVAVEQLEALQAEPPDGVDCCFTDVVASQLEANRAELAEAQRAAAEQKAPSMPLSTMPHKEANAISKAEKRLRAARQSLEQKQEAQGLVEAQLQKAQEKLAQLASRALHALEEEARVEAAAQLRQRAAEWAGASQVPGLSMQLDKLPEAWGSSNFEVAWAAIRSQVEAVRAQLAEAPAAPRRAPWAESRPMGEISSEGGDHAGGRRPWQPQCAAERGQAERRGDARGEWPKVAQACKRELAAEAEDLALLAARPARRAAGTARFGGTRPLDLGSAQAPPAPGQSGAAAQDVRCGLEEFGANGNVGVRSLEGAGASGSRSGAPPRFVGPQATRLAPHRLGEARGAERSMGSTAFLHASAPTNKEGQLANSGGVAGCRQSLCGVTVSTASSLQLLACSLGPKGFDRDNLAAFGDTVLYQRPRFISVVGLATETFSANGTGLAGPLGVARYVDGDIPLQAVGTEQLVAARFDRAGLQVVRRLRGQHLALSAAKTPCLAPAQGASSGLGPIHQAGPAASSVSGRAVTDNADGELHGWRLAACRSAGALPMGAERGLRMRCGELRRRRNLDPAALRAGHAVQVMAGLLLAGELPPMLMERGLEAAGTRRAKPGAPWKHCARPLDAGKLTRAWIGWRFKPEQCMVADLGDELDLMHRGPQELSWGAGPGARRAPLRHEMRKLSHDTYLLGACISNPRWTQARLLDAREQGQARCSGAERGTSWHRQHGSPVHEAQWYGRGSWLPAHRPPQGRRTDAAGVRCFRRPPDEKLNGKLYLDGATLEPLFGDLRWEGGAIVHRDGGGNLGAEVYGADGRDRCPQRAAKDGEDVEAWLLATLARRGIEHADRLALRRAQMHAVDTPTVGVHQAQAGFVQDFGRWIWCAVILGQGIEAWDGEGLPHAAERRQARFADAGRSQAAEEAKGEGPSAERPRLESTRSTGNSSAAFSASAVAFSILGHALSYACAEKGEDTQELVACSKCGAYMTLDGRSGVKPRLKERCSGDKTDKGDRNQRSLWLRGLDPGGRGPEGSRAARRRAKGEGIPTLRSQGPVPEHAQERCLEWLGTAAEPAADPSATASSAGSAPAAAAELRVAADPAAARVGNLGAFGVADEGLAAAAGTEGGALEGAVRRMGPMAFLSASTPTDKEGPLASSGGVAGWRQGWSGVTMPAASDLQLPACLLYLRGALGPIGFNLGSFAAFGDLVLYQRPRFVPVVGMASETCSTNGTGLARWTCSLTVAKPPGLATFHAAPAGGRPLGVARCVDGDIALQAEGAEQLVAAWVGGQLGVCGKSQGGTPCETLQARNLGSDPASAKWGAHEGRVRAAGVFRRARTLDPIHKAGPAASGGCGRTVAANADGELRSWRLTASCSAWALSMGAVRGLRMRYAELRRRRILDSAALRAGHVVQMKAGLLQVGELPPKRMERGLEAAETRRARTDGPWKRCASPSDAEMLTRPRIDWHFKSERCMIVGLGDELDLRYLGPQELGWEAAPGARRAPSRHETREPCRGTCLLGGHISDTHWAQARPLVAREQGQARCCGAERGTLWHRQRGGLAHEAQRRGRGRWLPADWPPQGRRPDAMGAGCVRRQYDVKLNGKLSLDDAKLEPLFGAWRCGGGATAHRDGDGNLVAEVYGAVGRDSGPQRTANGGEGEVAWMPSTLARPAVERAQAAEEARGEWPSAERPRLESARSTGNCSAALSARAVAFSILGHALSYACAGEGEDTQELVACSKCDAYMTLGGRSGVKPRLKERCPGDKTDRGGRNQRSLWLRGPHPGGRRQEGSRAARHRVKRRGHPYVGSQGPVPVQAQERYLEWFGTAAEPAADPSASVGSAGSAPAAAAEPRVAAGPGGGPSDAAAAAAVASLPKRRPAAASEGGLGGIGVVEEELAAAVGPAGGALEGRRVRRRVARRGGLSVPQRSAAKLNGMATRLASGRRWRRLASGGWQPRLRTWPLWLLVLLATLLGAGAEEPRQSRRVPSEASAAGPRQLGGSSAEVARLGTKQPNALGEAPAPPAPGRTAAAARGTRGGLEDFGASPTGVTGRSLVRIDWHFKSEQYWVAEHGGDFDPMTLEPRAQDLGVGLAARQARDLNLHRHSALTHAMRQALDVALQRPTADRTRRWQPSHEAWYVRQVARVLADAEAATAAACEKDEVGALEFGTSEWSDLIGQAGVPRHPEATAVMADLLQSAELPLRRKLSSDPLLLRPALRGAIGQLLGPGIVLCVRGQHVRGGHISNTHWTMRIWRTRKPVDGRLNGKLYLDGSAKSSRSTGSSTTALSAIAVAFSILGHALCYACAGEGEGAQEIVACSRRGAYKVLGSHAGAEPRLKERCPGDKTSKSGRNQRSLWGRGLRPGGRPRADKQRVKGEGIPALRSQGPVPGHAQERYLEWPGIEAESAGGASAAASSSGSGPAAPAAVQAAEVAAASLPLQQPASARAGLLGVRGTTEEGFAAADSTAIDGQAQPRGLRGSGHGEVPVQWRQRQAQQVLLDVQLRQVELGLAHLLPGLRVCGPAMGDWDAPAHGEAYGRPGRLGGSATWAPCPEAGPRSGHAGSIHQVADLGLGSEWDAQRLQAAVEQLGALQAEPPDGVDGCFTDVVASQLEAKRAGAGQGPKADAISKGEKRLQAARMEFEQKQEARDLVEAQGHLAQEKLAELDEELEVASLAPQALEETAREEAEAMRRQCAAEWTGASQAPGFLMQLEKLPEAWGTSSFEVAWAAIRAQMEAVRAQLEGAPLASKRTPWAESCPMDEVSGNVGGLADCGGVWQPQPAAERGQAERCGKALGEWPTVAQSCMRELAAEAADLAPLAAHPAGKAAGNRLGRAQPGPASAEWIEPVGRAGVPEPPEAMARSASPQLPTARAQRREGAAASGGGAATGVNHTSAVRDEVQAQWIGNRHLELERYTVMDLGGASNSMFLEARPWPGVKENATPRRARGGGDGERYSEQYVIGWAASSGGLLPARENHLAAAALSATAVAFCVLGHVLSYACVGEGEDAQEIAACTKCGANKMLGGRAGGRSRLKMQCPGPSNLTNKSRDQRSLWE